MDTTAPGCDLDMDDLLAVGMYDTLVQVLSGQKATTPTCGSIGREELVVRRGWRDRIHNFRFLGCHAQLSGRECSLDCKDALRGSLAGGIV